MPIFRIGLPVRLTIDLKLRSPHAPNKFRYTTRGIPLNVNRKSKEDMCSYHENIFIVLLFFLALVANYEVLATDYYNWTIEYDCVNNEKGGKTGNI